MADEILILSQEQLLELEMKGITTILVICFVGGHATVEPEQKYDIGETPPVVAEADTTIQVMTWPIVHNPKTCFPQRAVEVRFQGNRVLLDDVRWYKNQKPWLNDDRIAVRENGRWGFCDSLGRIVIPPQFEYVGPFAQGNCVVLVKKKYGYVRTDGSWLKKPQYEWAYDFTMGLGLVKAGDKWGVIAPDGDWIEQPTFRRLDPLAGGVKAETFDGKTYWYKKDPEFWKNHPQP